MVSELGFKVDNIRGTSLEGTVLEHFTSQHGELFEANATLDLKTLWAEMHRKEWLQKTSEEVQKTRDEIEASQELSDLRDKWDLLQRRKTHAKAIEIADIEQQENELKKKIEIQTKRLNAATSLEAGQIDLDTAEKETEAEVSHSEKLAGLYRRAQSVKIDNLKTDEDVAKFLHALDKDKVLREEDIESLKRGIRERNEDQEVARNYLLLKIRLEHDLALEGTKLDGLQVLDTKKREHELAQARKEFEWEQEQRLARSKESIDAKKAEIELSKLENAADLEGLAALQNLGLQKKQAEQRMAHEDAEHKAKMEAEILAARSNATVEALLSMMESQGDSGARAEVLKDIAKTKQFKDMSVDQILAMQAGDSGEVAKIFQARAVSSGNEAAVNARLDAAEKATEMERRHAAEMREVYDQRVGDIKEVSRHALDQGTQLAQTVASSGRGETVIVGAGVPVGPAVGRGMQTQFQDGQVKCPHCGAMNTANAVFCSQCSLPMKVAEGSRICEKCNKVVPPGNNFCPSCGNQAG
jgi:hypothetical protein